MFHYVSLCLEASCSCHGDPWGAFFIMWTSGFDSQSATSEASLPAKCFSKFRIDLDTDPEGDGTHDVSTSAEKDHPA